MDLTSLPFFGRPFWLEKPQIQRLIDQNQGEELAIPFDFPLPFVLFPLPFPFFSNPGGAGRSFKVLGSSNSCHGARGFVEAKPQKNSKEIKAFKGLKDEARAA